MKQKDKAQKISSQVAFLQPPLLYLVTGSTLNSIRQTDVDTLMIRTQSRVRVRVIYLNQTGIRHQILGGVGVRGMHSRWDALSPNPTHSILNCFFP